ncbi:MAG: glycosyltransferase [Chryseolinea sp.]
MSRLAIVIPAFKIDFFRDTLESLSVQTCQDFTIYIGDDASPHALSDIVKDYADKMTIKYIRFEDNLGSTDLVKHWNRCLDLVSEEAWLWLFSDDDTMDQSCVEVFYDFIKHNPAVELVHFDVDIIDERGKVIRQLPAFPPRLSSTDFFEQRIRGTINSYVVDFIFRRSLYIDYEKFTSFDLAWNADDAAWMKFAQSTSIYSISSPRICWRLSTQNISSIRSDFDIVVRKVNASVAFLQWSSGLFLQKKYIPSVSEFEMFRARILNLIIFSSLSLNAQFALSFKTCNTLRYKNIKIRSAFFIIYQKVKRMFT